MTKASINRFMTILAENDQITYAHSVRMGHMARLVADNVGLDRDLLQNACLTHDLGKLGIPTEHVLRPDGQKVVLYYNIEQHPLHSYAMLRDDEPKLAKVAAMHHMFQRRPYPEELPFRAADDAEAQELYRYAFAVSCLDYFDAATFRQGKRPTASDLMEVIAAKHHYDPEPGYTRKLLSGTNGR
jgi:putative nucleotidyltransferase with HDIG domain